MFISTRTSKKTVSCQPFKASKAVDTSVSRKPSTSLRPCSSGVKPMTLCFTPRTSKISGLKYFSKSSNAANKFTESYRLKYFTKVHTSPTFFGMIPSQKVFANQAMSRDSGKVPRSTEFSDYDAATNKCSIMVFCILANAIPIG